MTEPRWVDVPGPARGPEGADLGSARRPDRVMSARLSRHRLRMAQGRPQAGRVGLARGRAVHRGYAPSSIPADGSFHVGAMMDDALRVRSAAGGTERRRGDRSRLGRDGRHRPGRDARQPVRQGGDHVVAALGRVPSPSRPAERARLARQLPRQLLRSWYIFYFQLPWLPERSASWVLPLLWRRWSPGYRDAHEDLRHVDAAIGTPESWRAALGPYRATIRNTPPPRAVRRAEPALDRSAHPAEPVPAWSRRRLHDTGFRALDRKGAAGRQRG